MAQTRQDRRVGSRHSGIIKVSSEGHIWPVGPAPIPGFNVRIDRMREDAPGAWGSRPLGNGVPGDLGEPIEDDVDVGAREDLVGAGRRVVGEG